MSRAKESFAASMRADETYMQAQHAQVDDDWNYVHNFMYAVANLMELGELNEATALSAKLKGARGELENTLYPWSPRDAISRLDPRLPVALRSADWASVLDLLKTSDPPAIASESSIPRAPANSVCARHAGTRGVAICPARRRRRQSSTRNCGESLNA